MIKFDLRRAVKKNSTLLALGLSVLLKGAVMMAHFLLGSNKQPFNTVITSSKL